MNNKIIKAICGLILILLGLGSGWFVFKIMTSAGPAPVHIVGIDSEFIFMFFSLISIILGVFILIKSRKIQK